jgi:hypothetical protein
MSCHNPRLAAAVLGRCIQGRPNRWSRRVSEDLEIPTGVSLAARWKGWQTALFASSALQSTERLSKEFTPQLWDFTEWFVDEMLRRGN